MKKIIFIIGFLIVQSIVSFGHATPRNVEPTYAFCSTVGVPDVNFGCPYSYQTADEVFVVYKAWVAAHPNFLFKILDYYPAVDLPTTNGLSSYWVKELSYDTDGSSSVTGFVLGSRQILCPTSIYRNSVVRRVGDTNNVTVQCYGENIQMPDPACEKCGLKVGDPIYPATGTLFENEIDYAGSGSNDLKFSRTYRSDKREWTHNYQTYGIDFTNTTSAAAIPCFNDYQQQTGWPRCFKYAATGSKNDFMVQRSGHRPLNFGTDSDFSPAADISDRVTPVTINGVVSGFNVYNASDESTESFDTTGRLQSIMSRVGLVKTFYYSNSVTPANIAASTGLLIRVGDAYGRALNFTYDDRGRMVTMTDPAGGVTTYGYDENTSVVITKTVSGGNLTSVTYPDGKKRLYWYNEQDKTSGADLPFALTGVTDELGVRLSTFMYDAAGHAISTERAGSVEKFTVAFPSLWNTSTVTDPLGTVRTYDFQTILGVSKTIRVRQPGPGGVGTSLSSSDYDSQGNVVSIFDFNGTLTSFAYDLTRNLETRRVEGAYTPKARTITTEWHPTFRLPTKIAEPQRLTTTTYDVSGNVLTRTVQATSDLTGAAGTSASLVGLPRTVSYTYNTVGQVLTETGPRTDVASTATYTYDVQGNLATVTDAANHVTTYQNYDANGRVGQVITANGVVTEVTYSPRGWLQQRSTSAGGITETTSYDYDGAGQLKAVTLPDRSTMRYDYDERIG